MHEPTRNDAPSKKTDAAPDLDPEESERPTRSIKLPPAVTPTHRVYRRLPLVGRARMVTFGLLGFLASVLVRLVALVVDILTLSDSDAGGEVIASAIPLDSSPTLALIARVGLAVFGAIAAIAFIFWLQRARDNWSTQGRTRFAPNWTILMWLVPGLNLWRPFQYVTDLFAERPSMRRVANSDAWLVAAWWIPGVIGLFGQIGLRIWAAANENDMLNPVDSTGQVDISGQVDIASQIDWHYLAFGAYTLMGVSTISAIFIVRALTIRHGVSSSR